jgi:hypothetical protein
MRRLITILTIAVGLVTPAAALALSLEAQKAAANNVATARATNATACPNETVAIQGKPTPLRFVLRHVSCSAAHKLIRTYFHDIATQGCQEHGTACIYVYSRGWDCSFPIPALHLAAVAGCDKALAGRLTASVTVYKVTRAASAASAAQTKCSNETVPVLLTGRTPVAVTLRFVVRGVSCRTAHDLVRTYFRHEATPGYCLKQGNICAFVSGGWTCSFPLYAGEGGGDFVGCVREAPFATVKVYRVTRHASTAAASSSSAIAGELSGVAATPATAKRSCGTELVQPGTLGPPKTGSTTGPGIPYKIVVWRGSVSCSKARSLIKATGEGKGTWHEAPDIAGIYTSFGGGWRCALATGGGYGCVRGRRIGAFGHADEIDGVQL